MPRGKRRGRTAKKNPNRVASSQHREPEELTKAPHSFVVHRGHKVGKSVEELTTDFRKVMEPFTASSLKLRPKNTVKDLVSLAGPLNVTHLVMFTRTELGPYLRLCRFPRGPTLTFRINGYSLARDVRSGLKRQVTYERQYANHPLLVLNGFSGDDDQQGQETSLTMSMLQNMFPSIDVTRVKVNSIRRCVLVNRDPDTGDLEFRHYTIKVVPVGISRQVKKLVVQGKVPNLGRYENVSEFLQRGLNGGDLTSDSEADEDEEAGGRIVQSLPGGIRSRGNLASQKSAVRLVELGPRLSLTLVKVEDGLLDGEVLYHKLVSKTDEEKRVIRETREKRRKEKERRRKEQDANVVKKLKAKEEHKKKSLSGMATARAGQGSSSFQGDRADKKDDSDTDEEWYRKEVGGKGPASGTSFDRDQSQNGGDRDRGKAPKRSATDGGGGPTEKRLRMRMKKSAELPSKGSGRKFDVRQGKNVKFRVTAKGRQAVPAGRSAAKGGRNGNQRGQARMSGKSGKNFKKNRKR